MMIKSLRKYSVLLVLSFMIFLNSNAQQLVPIGNCTLKVENKWKMQIDTLPDDCIFIKTINFTDSNLNFLQLMANTCSSTNYDNFWCPSNENNIVADTIAYNKGELTVFKMLDKLHNYYYEYYCLRIKIDLYVILIDRLHENGKYVNELYEIKKSCDTKGR